jgi:hypothetical protein
MHQPANFTPKVKGFAAIVKKDGRIAASYITIDTSVDRYVSFCFKLIPFEG